MLTRPAAMIRSHALFTAILLVVLAPRRNITRNLRDPDRQKVVDALAHPHTVKCIYEVHLLMCRGEALGSGPSHTRPANVAAVGERRRHLVPRPDRTIGRLD